MNHKFQFYSCSYRLPVDYCFGWWALCLWWSWVAIQCWYLQKWLIPLIYMQFSRYYNETQLFLMRVRIVMYVSSDKDFVTSFSAILVDPKHTLDFMETITRLWWCWLVSFFYEILKILLIYIFVLGKEEILPLKESNEGILAMVSRTKELLCSTDGYRMTLEELAKFNGEDE